MENKYKKALKEVLINLKCIDTTENMEVESYVNDSIQIIEDALEEAAQEVPVQEQLSKEITEKLNANLPLYLKKLDVKEGSITHDVIVTIVGVFLSNDVFVDAVLKRIVDKIASALKNIN